MSSAPSSAPSPAPSTPIYDEVDRWWRDGGDEPAPVTMLSFPGTSGGTSGGRRRPVRVPSTPSRPRHLLA